MNYKQRHQREQEFNERHPQFQPITLMKNQVQTPSGEIIDIINGSLVCESKLANMRIIMFWVHDQDKEFIATIKVNGDMLSVDFPESVPVSKMESLLEAFEYQS